jgi:hypothetical protein
MDEEFVDQRMIPMLDDVGRGSYRMTKILLLLIEKKSKNIEHAESSKKV